MKFKTQKANFYINKYQKNKFRMVIKEANEASKPVTFNSIQELQSFATAVLKFCDKQTPVTTYNSTQDPVEDFVNTAVKAIDTTIKDYGTYNWWDKGPEEYLDLNNMVTTLKLLTADQCISALKLILKRSPNYGEGLVASIVELLHSWNDLWENEDRYAFLSEYL